MGSRFSLLTGLPLRRLLPPCPTGDALEDALEARVQASLPPVVGLLQATSPEARFAAYEQEIGRQRKAFIAAHGHDGLGLLQGADEESFAENLETRLGSTA